jgi:hypothetical protein
MTTNFKADVRARMQGTGEKYTEARRALLVGHSAAKASAVSSTPVEAPDLRRLSLSCS